MEWGFQEIVEKRGSLKDLLLLRGIHMYNSRNDTDHLKSSRGASSGKKRTQEELVVNGVHVFGNLVRIRMRGRYFSRML